tara:strand:+ start:120 stop:389 length:270 start_codon:yes stop_codon:yes gene_type:complete
MNSMVIVGLAPGDMLAISMTALLSFALGMIATILFVMARSGSSTGNIESDLLEEDEQEAIDQPHETAGELPESPRNEAWEKDSNWWKDQ